MHATEAMFLIISVVSICTTIFAFIYFRSREHLALIERGINPKERNPAHFSIAGIRYGLLLIGAGAGILMAYVLDSIVLKHGIEYRQEINDGHTYTLSHNTNEPAIYFALIAIGGGAGLIYSYTLQKKFIKTKESC